MSRRELKDTMKSETTRLRIKTTRKAQKRPKTAMFHTSNPGQKRVKSQRRIKNNLTAVSIPKSQRGKRKMIDINDLDLDQKISQIEKVKFLVMI